MQIAVKGRNFQVTPALKEYAIGKVQRVEHYFDHIMKGEIELSVERNPRIENAQRAEVTLFTEGPVIRAHESATDMYAAIDLVAEKLERQLKRYKGRMYGDKKNHRETPRTMTPEPGDLEHLMDELNGTPSGGPDEPEIVKSKVVDLKPMSPEEATMQMELLGHDFFVFTNSDTEETNVVYRRRDGHYGLIEPRLG